VDLEDYLAIPYVAVFYSSISDDGEWIRNVEYPELPDCFGAGFSAIEALDKAEAARIDYIVKAYRNGEEIPVPRPPLRSKVSGLTAEPVTDTVANLPSS
jgi:predicted RNase H-like HicB family nuclease